MTNPAERWERVQTLLLEALDRDGAERAGWLRAACDGDDSLVAEVESLLVAHDGPGPLGEASRAPRLFGVAAERIGPYRILRPLGRGGMGAVYLAERVTGDVTQTVALKLLPADLATSLLVDRFAAERRILARLEHAGIARLIDAGTAPDGQPYFAMEFVEGTDLVTWARKRTPALAERIRLMLAVCSAVEYAHRQLVVHRDLKPSNILVTDDGRPKLLDFGIAKLLEPEVPGAAATRTLHWLTPDYASPEQVRGDPVGTACDVYALGVLLYELFTDTRPFALDDLSPAAIELIICHQPPVRPSERVTSPALRRQLRGDLDTIVLKALAKEPERRYASVQELDDDLRRHLDQQPLRARPDTLAYRTTMFMRRHRVAVAAGAIVFASLVVSLAGVVTKEAQARRDRDRAESARRAAEDVSSFLVGMFAASDPAASPVDTAVARAIVRRGVERAGALSSQPLAQARILDALGMVYVGLGQYDSAFTLVNRALGLRRAGLEPGHLDIAESLRHVARTERARGHYREAEAPLLEALAIARQQAGTAGQATEVAMLDDLGFLQPYLGREDGAEQYRRDALAFTRNTWPNDVAQIADRTVQLALVLRRRGDYAEAMQLLTDALEEQRRAFGASSWQAAETRIVLADALSDGGVKPAEIEPLLREGVRSLRAAFGQGNLRLVHGITSLADVLDEEGRHTEAEALLREALDIRRRALGPDHPSVLESEQDLARNLGLQGRYAEAERTLRGTLAAWKRTMGPEHPAVASCMTRLAELLTEAGRPAEAEPLFRQALVMRVRTNGPGHVLIGVGMSDLATTLIPQGKLAEAETTLTRALVILNAHQRPTHNDVRMAHQRLATVYARMNRPADAARERALGGG